jgi:hypothetical protein
VGLFNANGVIGKADAILNFIDNEQLDIFFITETWVGDSQTSPIHGCFLQIGKSKTGVITGGRRNNGGIIGIAKQQTSMDIQVIYKCSEARFCNCKSENYIYYDRLLSPLPRQHHIYSEP